jgi:hypothetical protein
MRAAQLGRSAAVLMIAAGPLVAAGSLALNAIPAYAGGALVELNPSTIQAGYAVGIRASCGDNLNPAKVESKAFGQVPMVPKDGWLVAAVSVPAGTHPQGYDVKLSCPNGSTASTTLFVLAMKAPTRGPATGGGGTAADPGSPALMLTGGAVAAGAGAGLGALAIRRRRAARAA